MRIGSNQKVQNEIPTASMADIIFLLLIFFYAWRMNRLDRDYGVDEE